MNPLEQALFVVVAPGAASLVTEDASEVLAPVRPIPEWIYCMICVMVDKLREYGHELLGEAPCDKAVVRVRVNTKRIQESGDGRA
jgi:hypothetical protein